MSPRGPRGWSIMVEHAGGRGDGAVAGIAIADEKDETRVLEYSAKCMTSSNRYLVVTKS